MQSHKIQSKRAKQRPFGKKLGEVVTKKNKTDWGNNVEKILF